MLGHARESLNIQVLSVTPSTFSVSRYMTATFSISAGLYPDNIAFVYGMLETSNQIGRTIGPSIGGVLYDAGGFLLPFIVVGCILLTTGTSSLLLVIATSRYTSAIDDLEKKKANDVTHKQTISWLYFFRTSFKSYLYAGSQTITCFCYSLPAPTLALYLRNFGINDATSVGFVFLGGSAIYSISSVVAGRIADRFPKTIPYVCFYYFAILR